MQTLPYCCGMPQYTITGLNKLEIPDLRLHDLQQQNVHADLFLVQFMLVSKTNTLYPIYRTRCKKNGWEGGSISFKILKWVNRSTNQRRRSSSLVLHRGTVHSSKWTWGWFNEYISCGVKAARCVELTLPPSWDHCLEIWEPQPPGTIGACPGM